MKKIIILTGSSLRHEFFRKFIASSSGIQVMSSFCESSKNSLEDIVSETSDNLKRIEHLEMRNQRERDFFGIYCANVLDDSNPKFIEKGEVNDKFIIQEIIKANPDYIISYGCSIIKSELIHYFRERFINIHLGLSPYYRGSGTNYWPFVFNELQFVGVTFMYINEGIDTGKIIHQIRAEIYPGDTLHEVGNRLIISMSKELTYLLKCKSMHACNDLSFFNIEPRRYFSKKNFSEDSLRIIQKNLKNNMIKNYIRERTYTSNLYPIYVNKLIQDFR